MTALPGCLMFTRDLIRILIPVKRKSSHLSDCHCQAPTPGCWVGLRLAIEIPSLIHTVSVPYSIRMGLETGQTCRSVLLSESVLHSCVDRRLNSSSSVRERHKRPSWTLTDRDCAVIPNHASRQVELPGPSPYGTGWTRMAVFPSFHKELLQAGRHAARFPGSRTRYHKFITLSVSTGVVTVRRPGIG